MVLRILISLMSEKLEHYSFIQIPHIWPYVVTYACI